jgi:hypothetical protein
MIFFELHHIMHPSQIFSIVPIQISISIAFNQCVQEEEEAEAKKECLKKRRN